MLSKDLQGATVERVYWAVNSPSWLPTVGQEFNSYLDAKRYAEDAVSANSPLATLETRMVFRYPENYWMKGTYDTPVDRLTIDYNILIREPLEENRY